MKLTKRQLRKLIKEVINEVEFHGETPAGQLYDTEEEDARFSMHLEVEKELEQRPEVAAVFKAAKLDYDEMGYMLKAMVKDTPEAKNFWDTPAYEKLYRYLEQEHIPYEIISQSREHAQTDPAKWILGYLRGDELDQKSRNIMGMPEALPPQYGGWAGIGSKRHPPGPGGTSKRFRRENKTRKTITKESLQKIIEEEIDFILYGSTKQQLDEGMLTKWLVGLGLTLGALTSSPGVQADPGDVQQVQSDLQARETATDNMEYDMAHTIGEEVYNAAIANPKRFAKFSFSGARTAAGNPVIDHSYDVIAKSMEEMGMTKKEDFIFFGRMIGPERYKILAQKGMFIDPRPQGGATQQKKQPYPEGH